HFALPGTPNRWQWDSEAAREILHFGKWIMLSSLLGFLVASGDRLILGALVDATTLGQYAIGFLLVTAVAQLVAAVLGSVALPALSETWRTRPDNIRSTFYRLRLPVDAITLSLLGFLWVAGSSVVGLLYDHRYGLAGPVLEVLALGLFAVRYEVATQL